MEALIIFGSVIGYLLVGIAVAVGEVKASDILGEFSHDVNTDPFIMAWVTAFWPVFLFLGLFITPYILYRLIKKGN